MDILSGDEVHSDLFKRDASLVNDAALVRFMKEGASGRIYKAADGDSGRAIAVKIVDYFDNENKEETMEEARMHSTLDHKNIIKLHKYYTNKNSLIMHLEYFDGFDLSDIISAGSPVNREEAMRISGDVISALKYMHDKNITHNDVHEGNVMINSEGHVKLVDFGCAASETSAKSIDILKAESIFQRLCPVGSLDQFMYPAKKIKRKKKTNMLMTF